MTCRQTYKWRETPWKWGEGYGEQTAPTWRAVVLDYGVKRNILRQLAGHAAEISVLPASASFDDVMRHEPHGVLLSNGPGESSALLRKNSKTLPWNSFVPDLIVALMMAPAERPNSALKLFVLTLNSSTASTDGV